MSDGPVRVGPGLLTRTTPLRFRFDGREYQGLAGDTLASALLSSGVRLIGRSFKYHRPRGLVTAGPEEPCALVELLGPCGLEPNRPATTLEIHDGLQALSQNRWPSLAVDLRAINGLLAPFLVAGFYYKTFMWPRSAWERLYEPAIRRAAGLGRLVPKDLSHAPAETVHAHADVLVVGSGAAGLVAARRLGDAGLRVLLLEQDVTSGGGTLLDPAWSTWRESQQRGLSPSVKVLTRTAAVGAYGHGVYAAFETLGIEESAALGGLRERLHVIRARRLVLASGALERHVAFPDNDRPGVMLAGAALAYLRRYGVAAGRRPVFFVNSDLAYEAVDAYLAANIRCLVVDPRRESLAADRARERGAEVRAGSLVTGVAGTRAVRGVRVESGGRGHWVGADALFVSGGYSPAIALASEAGTSLRWQEDICAFIAELEPGTGRIAGAARGLFGMAAAAEDGARAADAVIAELGAVPGAPPDSVQPDIERSPLTPLWDVGQPGKAFVDLQNDVTTEDVRLSAREGFEHVEHMKRYTTHTMATDQGRIGGLLGTAVLAAARGVAVAQVGQVRPRPYLQSIPFAALAGAEVGEHFKPKRRLPLNDWHEAAGATFVATGLWLRPLVYSREAGWGAVLAEARAVRSTVGVTDVSTLGKIDVQGKDAARFLDLVYANRFDNLPVGRARYGIMLREDGMLFDDGTTSRLGPAHYLVTTTTANSSAVLEHLEFQRQTVARELDVLLTDVTDEWAQFAVAGPRAREVVAAVVEELPLAATEFPFMAAAEAVVAGTRGRVFRISFSGELAYELAVPAREAERAFTAILEAGKAHGIVPYGLDALNTLRIEKGHITGAELNGNTSADDLGFARMLKREGDFIGKHLAGRPGLVSPERLQLVGVRPLDRRLRLRNGAQLVAPAAPAKSLGYITSSTPSVELEGWVGLALLSAGRARKGETLLAASPIHGEETAVEITSPHHLDPENLRVRA
jgi:methylglutamate dehydrogenase subunit C